MSKCLPDCFSTFFDVSEVFKVNSQMILRLAMIDIHFHKNIAPNFMFKYHNFVLARSHVIFDNNVKTSFLRKFLKLA